MSMSTGARPARARFERSTRSGGGAATVEERVHAPLPARHRPAVVPAEDRLQDRAELLDAGLLDARPELEDRVRPAVGRLERPAAAADEVSRHREVEAVRRLGFDDLRRPAQPVGEEAATDDVDVAPRPRRAAVALHTYEDVVPPARITDGVADHLIGVVERCVHE